MDTHIYQNNYTNNPNCYYTTQDGYIYVDPVTKSATPTALVDADPWNISQLNVNSFGNIPSNTAGLATVGNPNVNTCNMYNTFKDCTGKQRLTLPLNLN
jgi:hypothetical protein